MKASINQWPQLLKQTLAPAYLISGDEPLLVQEACDQLRLAARQQGFEERLVFHADNSFSWQHLADEANALSLFATRRILEVRLSGKPSDKGTAFKNIISLASPDNLLLVISPRLDASTQKTTWVKAFESSGVWLPIWPIERSQYPSWLQQRCQQAGLQVERAAIILLAEQTEGNLLAAVQEIEKLKLLGLNSIDAESMQQAISDNARFDAFGLSDMAMLGKLATASRMLNGLKAEGVEPILILGALVRKIRQLLELKQLPTQERAAAFKRMGIWPKQQPPIQAALKQLSLATLHQALQKAETIDAAVKGSGEDIWRLLHELIALIAGFGVLQPN